jgi:proline iminopeptidase
MRLSTSKAMLYPAIEPHAQGLLDVGQGHQVYWEECGNPEGLPVVFLHGGPGGGCSDYSRRFFNPAVYRVVLFDQRGCGRSVPHGHTQDNFTHHLVADMERLRKLLSIDRWVLCGGSWGCTLALAYAQQHAARVRGIVMRGVFAARTSEMNWLYQPGGASQVFAKEWDRFASALEAGQRTDPSTDQPRDLLLAYDAQLQSADPMAQAQAAAAWCTWEDSLCSVHSAAPSLPDPTRALAMARISAHMFAHDPALNQAQCWGLGDGKPLSYLADIAGIIVQGQFDMVTPAVTAWQLHQAWLGSQLRMVHTAGHSSSDPALQEALVKALDDMASLAR